MHNYTAERNRKNRRSEAKVFDENKDKTKTFYKNKNEEEIEVDATIETTIKDFRNIIPMLIKVAKSFSIDDDDLFAAKNFCKCSNK